MLKNNACLILIALAITTISTGISWASETAKCTGCNTEFYLIEHLKGPFAEATGISLMSGKGGKKMRSDPGKNG